MNIYTPFIVKLVCDKEKDLRKYMYVLSNLFGKEFTTLDLPYKSSRSHELVKNWYKKGLIKITNYTTKAKKYRFNSTFFAKIIEESNLNEEEKEKLLEKLDELI